MTIADREPSTVATPTPGGVKVIENWTVGYVKRHPLASLATVGDQFVLGVRTLQYLILDLVTGRFPLQEFIRQGAFMAGRPWCPPCWWHCRSG